MIDKDKEHADEYWKITGEKAVQKMYEWDNVEWHSNAE